MNLNLTSSGWQIRFENGRLSVALPDPHMRRLIYGRDAEPDRRLTLVARDEASSLAIFIAAPLRLRASDQDITIAAEQAQSAVSSHKLFEGPVLALDIERSLGRMTVIFSDDRRLSVESHPAYLAWHVGCLGAIGLECAAGGRVSIDVGERLCQSCGHVIHGRPLIKIPKTCPRCRHALA